MNEFSPLCLSIIAQAVVDVVGSGADRQDAIDFLMDEERLFFFIDAGEISIKTGQMRREMFDPRKNKIIVRDLKRMRQAAL